MCSNCDRPYEGRPHGLPTDGSHDYSSRIDPLQYALKLVFDADQRVKRGQELTKLLMSNLGVNPFRP